ncbi:2-C-methyl-D-erythritol 2,4-cyclodiphosphate synthase [Leucothrix pacifica]|uniref:2-C-methyl-D-erythritol 2,4-cyclodiphosphate synthase n=1 Tax=Leucothrix pacifica TaxID=1247513 RepID=A0A317C8Z8_9GAMM|nr:2-C-methyl-D-erythritol 2,4-cyclodiphosphate synthase [Leucothrix pacifica]PWQ94978.1 2-C-methyl-D-erythritol 2,4-cyclodiphosphate synthase [Leucothrix pacifica]
MRIGCGYDVHAFGEGDHIMLGGVKIPHDQGFIAHSDGDVLLHALCDALLGALAMGDIGQHFPDTSSDYENIDSRILLRHVYELVKEKGYRLQNMDSVISAQAPKMAKHIGLMQEYIAGDLGVEKDRVGIKATTTEGLGFVGLKQGVAVNVSVLLYKDQSA